MERIVNCKFFKIVVIIVLLSNSSYSQIVVGYKDTLSKFHLLKNDSIVKIKNATLDSILLKTLTIPECKDEYMDIITDELFGKVYYEFVFENNKVLEKKCLKGIGKEIDTILFYQHEKIFKTFLNFLKIDEKLKYTVIVPMYFCGNEYCDSTYIKYIGERYYYCIQKKQSIISFDPSKNDFIPKNIEDCIVQLDKMIDSNTKKWIKIKSESLFSYKAHHGLGMWIRNNWGLWKISELSEYFNNLGIYHPDDMSGIIIDSYYRRINGLDIKLEEQINYYKNYWKKKD